MSVGPWGIAVPVAGKGGGGGGERFRMANPHVRRADSNSNRSQEKSEVNIEGNNEVFGGCICVLYTYIRIYAYILLTGIKGRGSMLVLSEIVVLEEVIQIYTSFEIVCPILIHEGHVVTVK
jgi:hypothetical protein